MRLSRLIPLANVCSSASGQPHRSSKHADVALSKGGRRHPQNPKAHTMKKIVLGAAFALPLLASALAIADEAGRHPHYIHALSDLRAAQWQIDHRRSEDGEVREDEQVSSDEVAIAIRSVTDAAYREGKDLGFQPPPDAPMAYGGRLHAAIDLLRAAHNDLALPEDDPVARGQQHAALLRVDAALHAAQRAIGAAERAQDSRE
jgi:hypothetical protein